MDASATRPNIGEFDDYRAFLGSMLAYLKATNRRFSYRYFSKLAGYSSPNFLKLVIDGKRNLSVDSIERFAKALSLDRQETDIFSNLVLLGQARTDEERNRYYARLQANPRSQTPAVHLQHAQFEVYSLWYALPIRELMLLPTFREDADWIARQLRPKIRASEARRALQLLQDTGLVARDPRGQLRPQHTKLSTSPGVASLAVRNYHRCLLQRSMEALDSMPTRERNITSVTVSLTNQQYDEVCQKIADFRQALLDSIDDAKIATGAKRKVYAVGFQVVPLSKEET